MSADDLYLEEIFTDRRVGTIQRLTPVDAAGLPDARRAVLYVGQTQILTAAGALPLSFEMEARSLQEAAQKFGEGAKVALQQTMERLEEMRREAASSIIVPEAGAAGALGGGMGGIPGGGKIRMP
jgi:phage tail sheath gpL-like